jgi:hypothetical protein
MRDYYAGDENAKDPTKLSQMRDYFSRHKSDAKSTNTKEFRSKWEYEQWLKQNKFKKVSEDRANLKSALAEAITAVEGMRSVREGEPGIKRVTRKRVDDSVEVRYHVLDSNGVTHKSFDDLNNAKRWLSANRDILTKD